MRLTTILLMALLSGCALQASKPDDLYRELGQEQGIKTLVTKLLYNIADDQRIADQFRDSNVERLRDKLVEQICVLSGGPCVYTGDTMAESHAGKNINDMHFNALVEDLIAAMNSQQISVSAQNRLIALLAPMHGDIVYH
ncbi:MAG: group 1 hemoglobin [Verrucomicrobiaceae bacterium]|nr:group 1 hemoglobin [Verrucomicrobiaceae bacterium]